MPQSSCRMDPVLAKTEPISDGGSVTQIMHLRRGESCTKVTEVGERSE